MAHRLLEFSPAEALLTAEVMFIQALYALAGGDANAVMSGTRLYDQTPTGTVNGVNLTFTLPVTATDVVVYADGIRVKGGGDAYTHSGATITFTSGKQPYSTISVDYTPV